jgi:hypothetical protein
MVDDAGLKHRSLSIDDSPLAEEIYNETMQNFNFLTFDNFKGSDDTQDPKTFISSFQKKLRVLEVSDAVVSVVNRLPLRRNLRMVHEGPIEINPQLRGIHQGVSDTLRQISSTP